MKISAKTEYACIAMLVLADRYTIGEPVRIREIADVHQVPARFLVQILLQLKGAGLVGSTRGACGGYRLLRSPDEITLGEVMEVIDGPANQVSNAGATNSLTQVLQDAWLEATTAHDSLLFNTTLADLVQSAALQDEPMYYI